MFPKQDVSFQNCTVPTRTHYAKFIVMWLWIIMNKEEPPEDEIWGLAHRVPESKCRI